MTCKSHLLFTFFIIISISSIQPSLALNITEVLSPYPEYLTYSLLLTQTKLADVINTLPAVTLLVVDNDGFKPFTGHTDDIVKSIISLHIIKGYNDKESLEGLKTGLLDTLFEGSGLVKGEKQGRLNVTVTSEGILFGFNVPKGELNARFEKEVTKQVGSFSVIHVSSLIAPPGTPEGDKKAIEIDDDEVKRETDLGPTDEGETEGPVPAESGADDGPAEIRESTIGAPMGSFGFGDAFAPGPSPNGGGSVGPVVWAVGMAVGCGLVSVF